MKYTLLQNGHIITGNQVINGDLLIGNSRIMAVEETITHHSFESEVIDLKGKYVLPGLLHYNCPFIAKNLAGEANMEGSDSSIYQALSHGATFIMDTLHFNQQSKCIEQLFKTREGCRPIISDFSFHMGIKDSCEISSYDIDYCFVHEGITSFFLPGDFYDTWPMPKLERLFKSGANYRTIFICDTAPLKKETSEAKYLKELKKLLDLFVQFHCIVLFLDIRYRSEMAILSPYLSSGHGTINVAINIFDQWPNALREATDFITINDLLTYQKAPQIMLLPPQLDVAKKKSDSFIEHGRNISFIEQLHQQLGDHGERLLPTLCDLYATRPARLLGIYPRKGVLKAGSDADLIIWAPSSGKATDTETSGTANTALLRKDIKQLFIGGTLLENHDSLIQDKMAGHFVHRSPPLL